MKKLFIALIAIIAVASSCSKVEPSNLEYSKYTNKATLLVQVNVGGQAKSGVTVNITVGDIHLQRVSDKSGKIVETIAFEGSKFLPSLTALYYDGNNYWYGAATVSESIGTDNVCKVFINLTQRNI